MGTTTPFSQLTGALQIYLAPKIEGEPLVNATPAGNWVLIGATDGDQKVKHVGAVVWLRDNDHTGPVKGVRPIEDILITVMVVGLTLENYSKMINALGNLTTATSPNSTKMPLKRDQTLSEYSLLFKGLSSSPYGNFPGQYYIPRCVQAGEPELVFGKGNRPGLLVEFHPLEDDTQSVNDKLGWFRVQTS
jgi:hypothetical protein